MKPRKSEQGQAILEFALLLPIFIFVGFGLVDVQWAVKDASNMDYIVGEVARCEALPSLACSAPNTPTSYAQTLATNFYLNQNQFTVTASGCNAATGLCTFTATYAYKAIGVYFPPITLTRTGVASQPLPKGE
jgi:Flp pilus assembly protein TadG